MNNPDSVKIIKRFYEALDMLIASNILRGIQTFTRAYDINKRNFYTARKEPDRDIFQMAWLSYLVRDFGVSSQWLMTGIGGMFGKREYPFYINSSKLKVSLDEIESYIGKTAEITYIPSERQRKQTGIVNAIKYDKEPALEIESEDKTYLISLYTIISIE